MTAAAAPGERIVLFQYNYPYQIWEDFAGPGIDAWRALVQARPVTAIFAGHTHYGQVANDGRNVVVATRSIGDPEGGPPGYLLAHLHGDDLAITYRSIEDRRPLVLIAHPRDALLATGPAHVVRGQDRLRALAWSGEPLVEVMARVDDEPWAPLEREGPQSWTGPLPGDRLSKGRHRVTVRAVDRRGGRGEQTIEVAVDPTGRYTAVPCVRPVVTATNFC